VKFDLINKPINLTRPAFDALVDVVMLPTNDSYTLELMDPVKNEELHDAEIDGMLQLWNVRPFASEGDEHDVAEDDALWKLTYDIDPINSASRYPTGFVRYQDIELNDGGKRKIMTHVLSISPLTISMMRVAKSYKVPTDQGDMEIPMTGEMNLQ
jgi:hypothetical protein